MKLKNGSVVVETIDRTFEITFFHHSIVVST